MNLLGMVAKYFKNGNELFPNGIVYASQGDCIYLVLDSADEAISSTVALITNWFSLTTQIPDIRAVLVISDIEVINLLGRVELISKGFEEISVIEKKAYQGQILITNDLYMAMSHNLFRIRKTMNVALTDSINVECLLINYNDPRLQNGPVIFSADEIEECSENQIQLLFEKIPNEVLATALHGLSPKMHELTYRLVEENRKIELLKSPITNGVMSIKEVEISHKILVSIMNQIIKDA